MSTVYNVLLSLRTEGDLTAKVSKVGSAAEKSDAAVKGLSHTFESVGRSISGAMNAAADAVASVGIGVAKWGGLALFTGAAYGVGQLNNQLEQTHISLAAIFQAQGLANNFAGGMRLATDQVTKMKTDVQTLPGTFGQLAQLMQTTATTGIGAGMDADALRKFAGRTMLTASIVAPTIDNNLLSKEIVNLLAGKAGTHNILGLRLGLQGEEAHKFNALSPEERLKKLNEIYDKYKDATEAISHSWRSQFTTLKDIALYQVLQPITKPLFDKVKADLVKVNDYFTRHKTEVEHYVNIVAYRLAGAWDSVVSTVEKLKPIFEWLGKKLETFHPSDILKGAKETAEIYAGLKVGSAALSMAAPAIGSMLAGAGGAAALGTAVTITAFLGATTLAAAGVGMAIVNNVANKDRNDTTQATADLMEDTGKSLKTMSDDFHQIAYDFTQGGSVVGAIGAGLLAISAETASGFTAIANAINHELFGPDAGVSAGLKRKFDFTFDGHLYNLDEHMAANKPAPRESPSTHIAKVEIVVKGSDDPTRVARKTLAVFLETMRQRGSLTSPLNQQPIRRHI